MSLLYPDNPNVRNAVHKSMERAFLPAGRTVKSLVMLSGGLDSVALLVNLLAHTTHEVHAHHIEIVNSERRSEAENDTLAKVLEHVRQHYRPFKYSTSKYELMMGLGGGIDMTLAMFMAARVVVAEGTYTDLVWTGHIASSIIDFQEASAVFTACFTYHRYKPVWCFPFTRCSKFDVYTSIPPALAEMTWSCRTPVYNGSVYAPCGTCHACDSRAKIYKEIEKHNAARTA